MSKKVVLCLVTPLLGAALASNGASASSVDVEAASIAYPAGRTAALEGLATDDSVAADVAVMNVASARSRCALALETASGARLAPVRTLTVEAGETRTFVDVLAEVRHLYGSLDARASVTCDAAFSTWAVVADAARDRVDVVPAVDAQERLVLRDTRPLCPVEASCFDIDGLAFKPEKPPLAQVGRLAFPAPAGATSRIVLSLDVKVGDWYAKDPGGKHLIYWFVINQNPDMPGMLYFRGPGKAQAMAVHGLGLKHAQKRRIVAKFNGEVGKTYHVVNDYDLAAGVYTVTISNRQTGEVYLIIRGKPNVSTFSVKANSRFLVDMGFPEGKVPREVPSWGWEYSNVHIEAYKPVATTP